MRSKLLLIILFLAIPTAAYADGWILWEKAIVTRTSTTTLEPTSYEKLEPTSYEHGFYKRGECIEAAHKKGVETAELLSKTFSKQIKAGLATVYHKTPNVVSITSTENFVDEQSNIRGMVYIFTCYPSDFDLPKKGKKPF